MTENPFGSRSRSDRAQRLYAAREMNPAEEPTASVQPQAQTYTTEEVPQASYRPVAFESERYTPNEPENDPAPSLPKVDYSAYARRESANATEEAEPTFAPPIKLDGLYGYTEPTWPQEEPAFDADKQGNVYRPLEATWAETGRMQVMGGESVAYQVHAEETAPRRRHGRHTLRNTLIALAVIAVLGAGAWFLREPLLQWIAPSPAQTQEPFKALTTPSPVKAYNASPAMAIADGTRSAIGRISGSVSMEPYAVTETHVVTRNRRPDGTYDFYLFTADEGRLLAYFDGLDAHDLYPQENGMFYVKQKPWLVGANGSALIRTAELEAVYGEGLTLLPLHNGWAMIETKETGARNYINTSGQLIDRLWFSRAFPFTGNYTAAYVDTGVTADSEQRYLLYVLGADGTMSRWRAAADMQDLVAAVCGMAYMSTGELYRLPDTSAPVATTDRVEAYVDCDALVVRDPESGKYGLFVHGEQHYDFAYDRIAPVESDMQWSETTLQSGNGRFAVHAVTGAAYPQPVSHSFVLEKDGQSEYVALSATSVYPVCLDGEF